MDIAEKIIRAKTDYDEVLDAGWQKGRVFGWELGKEQGIEEGKTLGKREWMEEYRKGGGQYNTRYCMCMFGGYGWTNSTFNPIHDIIVANAQNMFYYSGITANVSKLCEERGVMLDFSPCTNFSQTFMHSSIGGIDTIDTRSCADLSTIFANAKNFVEINNLVLKDDGSQTFGKSSFSNCLALVTLRISGKIAGTGIDLSASRLLSTESLRSVLGALEKDSTLASGKKITFSTAAAEKISADAECAQLYAEATAAGWSILYA